MPDSDGFHHLKIVVQGIRSFNTGVLVISWIWVKMDHCCVQVQVRLYTACIQPKEREKLDTFLTNE